MPPVHGIRAGTEKQDGKDEHDTCGNDAAQALAHIICAEDGKCLGKAGAERDDLPGVSFLGLHVLHLAAAGRV